MAGFKLDHYMEELKENIKTRDKIKAGLLLDHFTELDPASRNKVLFEISRADDAFAIPLIFRIYLKESAAGAEREKVKDLLFRKIQDYPFALLEIIQDEKVKDKKLFIEWAGMVQSNHSVPVIINILRNSDDVQLNETCLAALGRIGNPKVVNEIADYMYSGSRALTLTAIEALADMGTAEAARRLSERLGTDYEIDKRILQAFARIQDHFSLDMLNRQLLSQNANLRNFAIEALTKSGAKSIPFLVDNLAQTNVDLLIHSLTILGNIGDDDAAGPIRKLLFNEPPDANVRFTAYEALGKLSVKQGAYVLTEGLVDSADQVRIAAARALEKNMDKTVLAGICNLLQDNDEAAEKISIAFLNAEASRIFERLIEHDVFRKKALTYLSQKAHPDIRAFFGKQLEKMGRADLIKQIYAEQKTEQATARPLIYAVDDSRMILKVYKSALHQSGYPMELFEFPESALESVKQERPALLITDLNMPVMNGIELTRAVRKLFSKEELPVLMVTTQQDLADRQAAFEAGISGILYKPFDKESLEQEIEKLLG